MHQEEEKGKSEAKVQEEKVVAPPPELDAVGDKKATLSKLNKAGVYIPPFRLSRLQQDVPVDKSSAAWQRLQWEALRKSINGLVNKVSAKKELLLPPVLSSSRF